MSVRSFLLRFGLVLSCLIAIDSNNLLASGTTVFFCLSPGVESTSLTCCATSCTTLQRVANIFSVK